jgi:hypothetical protein
VPTDSSPVGPADALSSDAADYRSKVGALGELNNAGQVIDGSTVDGPQFGERNGYTAKLSGYFVGPYTGVLYTLYN